jgi:hypothetical protein
LPRSRLRIVLGSAAVIALVIGGAIGTTTTAMTAASADGTSDGGLFTPLQQRVLDTRNGTGGLPVAKLTAGTWHAIPIDGQGTLPSSNIAAVQVAFTTTNQVGAGVVHADQDGIASPNTTLPYATYGTSTISNSAVIPVGADGKIQVEVTATADLIVDVQGYYTGGNAAGGGYVPAAPTQVYNSGSTQYGAGQSVTFPVAGLVGVPSNASSVMLDVIEANGGTSTGYLVAYPAGSTRPTSTLDWPASHNYEWTTPVSMNSTGDVTIYIGPGSGSVSLSVGVEGYFTASDGTTSAGEFTPTTGRVFDSTATAPIAAGGSVTVPVAGLVGLPDTGSGIDAVAANIEISPSAGATGHIQVSPDDAPAGQSAQQFYSGVSTFAFDVVGLGADGGVTIYNSSSSTINVILDVEGWYQGLDPAVIVCPDPYQDGSWASALPSPGSTTTCVITGPTALGPDSSLTIDLNGDSQTYPLSTSTQTAVNLTVPLEPGTQTISVETDQADTGAGNDSSYSFGLGDWVTAPLTPTPSDLASVFQDDTELSIASNGDQLPDDSLIQYTVSQVQADGSTTPVVTSDWIEGDFTVPATDLVDGGQYQWTAEIQAASDNSTNSDLVSPVYRFSTVAGPGEGSHPDRTPPDYCSPWTTTISNVKTSTSVLKSPHSPSWWVGAGPGVAVSLSHSVSSSSTWTHTAGASGGKPGIVAISYSVGYSVTSSHQDTETGSFTNHHSVDWTLQAEQLFHTKTFNWSNTRTCSYATVTHQSGTGRAYHFIKLDYTSYKTPASDL